MNDSIPRTEAELEQLLSEPTDHVIATLQRHPGDLIALGVAGKMGPTLARMARRALDAAGLHHRVIGVARFTAGGEAELHAHGIETIRCDLLDEDAVSRGVRSVFVGDEAFADCAEPRPFLRIRRTGSVGIEA